MKKDKLNKTYGCGGIIKPLEKQKCYEKISEIDFTQLHPSCFFKNNLDEKGK